MVSTVTDAEPFFVASVSPLEPTLLEKVRLSGHSHAGNVRPELVMDEVLLVSSLHFKVLDSGCGKTIIGKNTHLQFQQLWKDAGIKPPTEKAEVNQFRFANGQVEPSSRLVDLQVGLAGKSGVLQAAVVKGSAPLLVSRHALKRLGANINFAEDRLKLFHDRCEMPLEPMRLASTW